MKVYYGVDRKAFAKEVKYPMVSFRTMQKRKTPIVTNGKEWFMDSGAFTYLKEFGKFPYSIGKYLGAVAKFKPTYYANMDWCCEPDILKSTRSTILHHIANTIENGRQLIDFDKKHFVMIVQGWTIKDYLTCIDYIREQGLFTTVLGIGTMCCRKKPREVFDLLKSIKASIPDWCKLHCFGLSIDMLKYKEIFDQIDSVDTFAWIYYLEPGNETRINYLKEYQNKVDHIISRNKKQSILTDIN